MEESEGTEALLKHDLEVKISESNKFKVNFQNKYFESLLTEAANTPINNGDTNLPTLHWVNPYLVREGQAFFRRNFDSVIFAHFVGLTIVYSYKPIASVLLRTGGTHVRYNSRMRYLSTIVHLKKWYESDLLRKSAKGAQDVIAIRKVHAKVLDLLLSEDESCMIHEEDLILSDEQESLLKNLLQDAQNSKAEDLPEDFNSYDPEILMSQLDMVLLQFAFMGVLVMAPEKFSIWDRMGLTGFIHIWAIIGNLLGIDDRFNLGLHQDQQTLDLIAQAMFVPCFRKIDEGVMTLWQGMFDGVGKYAPFMRLKPILHFIYKDVLKTPSRKLYAGMTRYEKFCYHTQAWKLNHAKRNSVLQKFANCLTRIDIHFAVKKFMRNSPNTY